MFEEEVPDEEVVSDEEEAASFAYDGIRYEISIALENGNFSYRIEQLYFPLDDEPAFPGGDIVMPMVMEACELFEEMFKAPPDEIDVNVQYTDGSETPQVPILVGGA